MTLLSFVLGMLLLGCSGYGVAYHVLPAGDRAMRIAFALPFGALIHALFLCALAATGVPIIWWSVGVLHVVFAIAVRAVPLSVRPLELPAVPTGSVFAPPLDRIVRIACIILLSAQFVFAFSHAVILPTYHIDSLTNWTMRAEVSWIDQHLALDRTEVRGVAKPQYPFLVHGLQMAANIAMPAWSDRNANASTLLLTLSSLAALFLLLRRFRGTTIALVALSAVTSIPLLSFHLAQGYGDIHLVTYLCLALATLIAARLSGDTKWLHASGFLVAAAAWTKTEGAVIGLLPWLLIVGIDLPWSEGRRDRVIAMARAVFVSVIFPAFLLFKGLPLSPHESDATFGFHTEAFGPALAGFLSPSMGLTWPALAVMLGAVLWMWRRKDPRIDCRLIITLFWGLLGLAIVLATYTLTPNVRFLLNGESYFRQLMIPASLLIVGLAATLKQRPQ